MRTLQWWALGMITVVMFSLTSSELRAQTPRTSNCVYNFPGGTGSITVDATAQVSWNCPLITHKGNINADSCVNHCNIQA